MIRIVPPQTILHYSHSAYSEADNILSLAARDTDRKNIIEDCRTCERRTKCECELGEIRGAIPIRCDAFMTDEKEWLRYNLEAATTVMVINGKVSDREMLAAQTMIQRAKMFFGENLERR